LLIWREIFNLPFIPLGKKGLREISKDLSFSNMLNDWRK